eukprot:2213075-Prymnesium_polylepis.2
MRGPRIARPRVAGGGGGGARAGKRPWRRPRKVGGRGASSSGGATGSLGLPRSVRMSSSPRRGPRPLACRGGAAATKGCAGAVSAAPMDRSSNWASERAIASFDRMPSPLRSGLGAAASGCTADGRASAEPVGAHGGSSAAVQTSAWSIVTKRHGRARERAREAGVQLFEFP